METRRSFLGGLLTLGMSVVGALLAIPLARFSLDPLWRTTSEVLWSDVGASADFTSVSAPVKMQVAIEQRDGLRKVLSQNSVYIVKAPHVLPRVLAAGCPHLRYSVAM